MIGSYGTFVNEGDGGGASLERGKREMGMQDRDRGGEVSTVG